MGAQTERSAIKEAVRRAEAEDSLGPSLIRGENRALSRPAGRISSASPQLGQGAVEGGKKRRK
jgi:hypothetical protein